MQTHPQLLIVDTPYRHLVERAILGALLTEAQGSSYVVVYSWSELQTFRKARFWSRPCNSTYVVDLSADEETLFKNLDGKRRNGIRLALKRGLEVREANRDDVSHFYKVLEATHERLGIESPLPFGDILTPETNRQLLVAYHGGQCVAGTIIRYHRGGQAEYSENASLPEFWRFRPNDLLLWESIKWSKSVECTAFNLAGHNVFKRQFGGLLYPIYQVSLDKSFLRWRHGRQRLRAFARRLYSRLGTRLPLRANLSLRVDHLRPNLTVCRVKPRSTPLPKPLVSCP
jgi:hypothetical protein